MFPKIVKFTFFSAYIIPVLDLRFKFNFNQFYQFIRDFLRTHTTKVGPFIFISNASDNEGNEIPQFLSVLSSFSHISIPNTISFSHIFSGRFKVHRFKVESSQKSNGMWFFRHSFGPYLFHCSRNNRGDKLRSKFWREKNVQ